MTLAGEEHAGQILSQDVRGRVLVTRERRESLLEEYDRSGMSGVRFAKYVGIKYTTLAYWLKRRRCHREREKLLMTAQVGTESGRSSGTWVEAVVDKNGSPARGPAGALRMAEASLEREFLLWRESTAAWALRLAELRNWFLVARGILDEPVGPKVLATPQFSRRARAKRVPGGMWSWRAISRRDRPLEKAMTRTAFQSTTFFGLAMGATNIAFLDAQRAENFVGPAKGTDESGD